MNSRFELIFANLDIRNLVGLEIGPLDKPLVARSQGTKIFYADYAPRSALQERSKGDPNVNVDAIPEIDYLIAPMPEHLDRKFDYIVASHVGEHVPDFIGWIKRLSEWLTHDGKIILALPDKRYTFDYERELSTVGQMIEAYLEKRARPSVASIYDGFSKAVRADVVDLWKTAYVPRTWYSWKRRVPQRFDRMYTTEVSLILAKEAFEKAEYRDCHCWVFTSETFRSILEELRDLGILDFHRVQIEPPRVFSNEFYVRIYPKPPEAAGSNDDAHTLPE